MLDARLKKASSYGLRRSTSTFDSLKPGTRGTLTGIFKASKERFVKTNNFVAKIIFLSSTRADILPQVTHRSSLYITILCILASSFQRSGFMSFFYNFEPSDRSIWDKTALPTLPLQQESQYINTEQSSYFSKLVVYI